MKCYGFKDEEVIKKYGLGKIDNLTNEEYHKIPAISASDLKEMQESIDRVVKKHLLKKPDSAAMNIGTALHEALLEPEKFRFSAYRMKPKEAENLNIMINNARVMFEYALNGSMREVSFLAADDVFLRKCRPDAFNSELGIVFDVKTSRYGDIKSFTRYDLYGRNYDIQAAWYLDTLNLLGYKAEHFVFLVVQNQSPFNCFALELHESVIEKARAKYADILERYREYCENGKILDVKMVYDWEYLQQLEGE